MSKTYRQSHYGKKILEGSGSIKQQEANPSSTSKILKKRLLSTSIDIIIQDKYLKDKQLVSFINWLKYNHIELKPKSSLVTSNKRLDYKYVYELPEDTLINYEGTISKDWFIDNKLKGEYIYHEINKNYEVYIEEVPDTHFYGGYEKGSKTYKLHKTFKHKKQLLSADSSYEEYLDMLEKHIFDHCYYYTGTYRFGQIYPHTFGRDYTDELEEAGII